ncbi:hypothetical protein RhiirA1_461355 [Rhizophagus irregularis]|uniref:Uncharacterized protein n=1 Tax=Rhizophagus irregularis TaxID=588596 RepID=A0A2N0RPJ0_9GLOM|nr:hypothetical protein RhiirA1_461355 [Rhizophagus irregularis]GET54061.1 hypothetical protein RIR_jg31600.t1 [Rhizophagus irregularis DAOM 181602=DAOM 197198]CAG8533646.1 18506_t:CDS:2 [Rhizophagus irregularis]
MSSETFGNDETEIIWDKCAVEAFFLRVEVAGIFRNRSLSLLNDRFKEWNQSDSESILQIIEDPQLSGPKITF